MPERDAYDIFRSPPNKNRNISIVLALFFHAILFLINFPHLQDRVFIPETVMVLRPLASPPEGLTKTAPEIRKEKAQPTPKPKEVLVPIPDPTPQEPEITKKNEEPVSPIVSEIKENIDLGEIKGPLNDGGGKGEKKGPDKGKGESGPGEEGYHKTGDTGVSMPQLLRMIKPNYTDEAIKAKVEGAVIFEAVVMPDGSIDKAKLIQSVGYGLDERAIEVVLKEWKFIPGKKGGKPVPVLVLIEIEFNLK